MLYAHNLELLFTYSTFKVIVPFSVYLIAFFNKFKNFIKDRLFSSKETSAKYYDITYDMYSHGVIDKDTMIEFKDEYDDYKEYLNNKSKHHDDFEL